MPAEFGTATRSRTRIAASAVTELGFALFVAGSPAHRERMKAPPWLTRISKERPGLRERVVEFWHDIPHEEWGELLLLAWRADALLLDDPTRLFGRLEALATEEFEVPELPTEPQEVRDIVRERLRALRESPERRQAYITLLREFWGELAPDWQDGGRATARAIGRELERQFADGKTPRDVLPKACLAWRDRFPPLVDAAFDRGELAVAPLGLVREGQYFFALPGILLVGFGAETEGSVERQRERAEKAAARFKVLSDPTRLSILVYLLTDPASISDLAQALDLSQPTVSVHMKMLREAALVESERRGSHTVYRASPDSLRGHVEAALSDVVGRGAG